MIDTSNPCYLNMKYYLYIFLTLIVEWRTARCGIHVCDSLSHYIIAFIYFSCNFQSLL